MGRIRPPPRTHGSVAVGRLHSGHTGRNAVVDRWLPGLSKRWLVAWMALGLVCSSAVFAVWTSAGGLETRQFTLFIVLAVGSTLYPENRRALLGAWLSLAAAALTRPEGPLFAGCCSGWYAIQRWGATGRWRPD